MVQGQSNNVIFTRPNCDGICAAAIALHDLNHSDVQFVQSYTLNTVLDKLDQHKHWTNIYIFDLVLNSTSVELLSGYDVVYIDHHRSSKQYAELYEGLYSEYISSSMLAAQYFEYEGLLGPLGSVCDKMNYLPKYDPLLNEANVFRAALHSGPDTAFWTKMVQHLSRGCMPSVIPDVLNRAKIATGNIEKYLTIGRNNIKYDDEVVVVDLGHNAGGYGGLVATRIAIESNKPTFAVYSEDDPGKYIIVARAPNNFPVDLSDIMAKLGGGGHPGAAAGSFYDSDRNFNNVLDAILKSNGIKD